MFFFSKKIMITKIATTYDLFRDNFKRKILSSFRRHLINPAYFEVALLSMTSSSYIESITLQMRETLLQR